MFAFDPERQAIMLIAGNQSENWTRWHKKNIPVDRERVEAHKKRILAEVRAYRLRELRDQTGPTQAQLAERIGVGQRQVSKIERGDLDNA